MRQDSDEIKKFLRIVGNHYRAHGRILPWRPPLLKLRKDKHARYKILISELMLQQTQVERVLRYYPRFLNQFPNFQALAASPLRKVLAAWQGLGYNRRAIFLKKIARRVHNEHHDTVPSDPAILATFSGIGKNTAGAVAAFAFNRPAVFLETNIRRAFIHFFFPRRRKVRDKEIMPLIEKTLDRKNPRQWYYALMDYGAHLGRQKQENPNRRSAHYARQSRFKGSDRQMRADIIRLILAKKGVTSSELAKNLTQKSVRVGKITVALEKEGFITKTGKYFVIATKP